MFQKQESTYKNDSRLFQLQDQLLRIKKQFNFKQNQWKREKMALNHANQIMNMEILQLKHRENNLKKINQTLTLAFQKINNSGVTDFKQLIQSIKQNVGNHQAEQEILEKANEDLIKLEQEYKKRQIQQKQFLQEQFRHKEQNLRSRHQKEIQSYKNRMKDIESQVARYRLDQKQKQQKNEENQRQVIMHYEQQIRNLKNQIIALQQANQQLNNYISQLLNNNYEHRQENDQIIIPSIHSEVYNNSHMKNTIYQGLLQNSINSELLCSKCGANYSNNDYYDHYQECQQADQQRKKSQIKYGKQNRKWTEQKKNNTQVQIQNQIKNIINSMYKNNKNLSTPQKPEAIGYRYNNNNESEDEYSKFSIKNSILRPGNRFNKY